MSTSAIIAPANPGPSRHRLAIFDFDGTLADSFPWFISVLNGVADRYGFNPVLPDEMEMLRGYDARQIMRHLRVPGWKLPLIANHMRRLMARDIHAIRLFDGVPALLRTLDERGVAVAVVSSNSETNIRRVLGRENAALVAHFACGSSLFGKAAKFRALLRRTRLPAGSVIAIGDEIRDIEAARRVGMACAAVTWGYSRGDALAAHRPDHLVDRIAEIAALF
ncbi:HAD hydrolase-like protein [Azospirillum picis]|uniref:Phosphoglycolate phosphatase n=1 Tax=Azospirillum picis TaxID=488438 RepID=A0ABU0MGI6_9PROT|nr:HAD hydrolase-like protein [Azospirillum picis]MBP2298408.1 phosphoglycolate phosphatase [Azospirillum picis]MDQ0532543.1 phosphoglycolate phosphatase [Azospirillum picis]